MATTMIAKDVKVGIKNGMSVEDFCEKFHYTEDEFQRRLGHIYPHTKEKVLSDIKRNDKKRHLRPRKQQPKPIEKVESQKGGERMNELEQLKNLEQTQSQEVIRLENEHKDLATKHKGCIKKLRDLKGELENIKAKYLEKSSEYEQIVIENNDLVHEMNQISKTRAEKVQALQVTRQQIEDLTKVVVAVYQNGNLEVVEGPSIDFDYTGTEELFDQLIRKEDCEDLTAKQIRILAKVIIVSKNNRNIEFIFDDNCIENTFKHS